MQYKPPTGYLVRQSVNRYATLCLITIGLFLLVRLIEILYISGNAGYPPGSTFLMLYGMRYDLMLALRFSALLMLPFIVIDNLSKVTARVFFILSALAVLLADLMLLQYFAIHKIPLGSEILNYSFQEIIRTVKSSGELNLVNLLVVGLFVLTALLAFLKWSARELSRDLTVVVIVLILFSVLPFNSTNPDRIDFRNDLRRNITANKVNALAAELVTHYLK